MRVLYILDSISDTYIFIIYYEFLENQGFRSYLGQVTVFIQMAMTL